jgi:peptidoglycan/LPS O-acetylase OafA/YrhL
VTDDVLALTRSVTPERTARHFVFLDVLRAIAVCLVIYCHLVGIWLHQHHFGSSRPLAMALNLGNAGVVLFFLVSGFVVTHAGFTERPRQYAVKRLLRIYPMLVVAVLLSALLFTVHLNPLTTGAAATVTPVTLVTNASLANYLIAPPVVLIDVGWTLVIEVTFYALLLVALPLLRRAAWPVVAGELGAVAAVLGTAHQGGTSYFLFAVNVGYLPALLLGQVVWAVWSGRVRPATGVVLGAAAVAEYVWAAAPGLGRQQTVYEYDLTLAIGFAVFLVGLSAERKIRRIRWVRFVADRSYSLYLLHGVVGYATMNLLFPLVGYPAALVAGIAVTVLCADAAFRIVERPGMRLARRIV